MQIKRNSDMPLSRAEALVELVRRYVLVLDPEATPHESGIVRSLVPVLAGAGGIWGRTGTPIFPIDPHMQQIAPRHGAASLRRKGCACRGSGGSGSGRMK